MSRQIIFLALFCQLATVLFAQDLPFEVRNVGDYEFRAETTKYRLPTATKPESYDISLSTRIDSGQFDFSGIVKIGILVVETTQKITLHTRQLTLSRVKLTDFATKKIVDLLPWSYEVVTEFLTISTQGVNLIPGQRYELEIEYSGILRSDNGGFYRSSYINSKGKQTWLATTQFEPTNARHAFPCYDEPALKAKFTIQIQHGRDYTAISNMPEKRVINPDQTATTYFDATPLTSTYLIAFIVSDFQFVDNPPTNKFRHRVFANPQVYQTGKFAVGESEKILDAIANYLQIPFTLPKMDQAAIPDFSAGAMENWGLVTYRQEYLLYDENVHLFVRKNNIVGTVAHEFGHQWFGNLVAPKWWDVLWLNEGFATLFETLGTDLVHPEWNIYQHFVVKRMQTAFRFDASDATRPMTFYVESPEAIGSLFDNIAYAKSGSVLRMFLHAFTEASFKKGLNYYLTAKQFDAAVEDDLFAGLERAVKEDKTLIANLAVKDIFSSWTQQKGFPVLHVTRNNNGTLTISQERYFTVVPQNVDPTTWWIPFNVASKQSPSLDQTFATEWLPRNQRSRLVGQSDAVKWTNSDWVLLNQQQTGYYRIQYDTANYNLLTNELVSGDVNKIHPLSRAQLIDDLLDFTSTQRLPVPLLLDLLKYLKNEREYGPWVTATNAINFISKQLATTPQYVKFKAMVASAVEPAYKAIGLADSDKEPYFNKFTRVYVTNLACEFGVEACLNENYEALKKSFTTKKFDSQNNRGIIYANGIRKASESDINTIWTRFTQEVKDIDERGEILNSFGYIGNVTLLSQYLNRSLVENDDVRFTASDRYVMVNSIARQSQNGLTLVLNLLSAHTTESVKLFAHLNQLLLNLADRIVTKELQTQYVTLLKTIREKFPGKLDEKTANKATAQVNQNLKWLEAYQTSIATYFKDKPGGAQQIAVSSLPLFVAAFFLVSYFH